MSSRDRDTKSLQDKLKVFFKKGASAPLPAVNELVVSAELERELGADAAPSRRLRTLRDLGEKAKTTRIQNGGVEKLWQYTRDLLNEGNTELRQTALWFLRCLAEGQTECSIMRTIFFRFLRETHAGHPVEDAQLRFKLLHTLTNAGRNIECFEEQIGPFLLEWLPTAAAGVGGGAGAVVISGAGGGASGPAGAAAGGGAAVLVELLQLVINVVKFNATYLDEEIVHGIVNNACHLCVYWAEPAVVHNCLALLEAVVSYSLLPRAALPAFVAALCRAVNLEPYCQTSWKLMRSVLGADIGHAALAELVALPAGAGGAAVAGGAGGAAGGGGGVVDAGLLRGAVFYINMALWGPRRVALRVSLLAVLPALQQAVNSNQPVVTYEIILAIQSLVSRAPPDSLCAAWDALLSVLQTAIQHDRSLDPPNELIHSRLHALLTQIEQLQDAGQYSGDADALLDLLESCSTDRPEASVLRVITLRCAALNPVRAGWLQAALAAVERYIRADTRPAVRLHALQRLLAAVQRHRFVYEDEVVSGLAVPVLSQCAQDSDPALRGAAARALAGLAQLTTGDATTDLIDSLEKIMNRPFENEDELDPEADMSDVALAVNGLLELFHCKLLRAPAAHAARACLVLLDHLELAYRQKQHPNHAECRRKILEMIFGLRANQFNCVGFCYDANGSPVYGAAALRLKPLCSPSLLAEPLAARAQPHPPPAKDLLPGTCVLPVGRCARLVAAALLEEKEWAVLAHVLRALPALLQARALAVGRRAQDLANLSSTLIAMVSDRSLCFPECLRVPSGQKLLMSEFHCHVLPSLAALAPYHGLLEPAQLQQVVRCLLKYGMVLRTPQPYITALTIFTLETRETMFKMLPKVLLDLSKISDTKLIASPMLEFLSTLTRLPRVFASFVEDQYMSVFAILLPYTNPSRYNHYVVSLAHHVIAAWFLKCRLSYRRNFVRFIIHGLHNYIILPIEEQYKGAASLNEDSSNRKRSSSLGSRGVSSAPLAAGNSSVGRGPASAASASAAFHVELTETCVDLLARYTSSPCSVKPHRSDTAEFMLNGGQSATWLVGHKLITITTPGCSQNSLKQGMCDRCMSLCRQHAESAASPLPPLAPPYENDVGPTPVQLNDIGNQNHNNNQLQVTQNPPEIKRYSKPSLQHSRSDTSASSLSISDALAPPSSPLATRQNSSENNPVVEALNNFAQRFEKISKEVDTEEGGWSRVGELATGGQCPCWCANWAEIHVRSPTGDVACLLRVQNQMGWDHLSESPLQDILALLTPSAHTAPPSSASSGIGDSRNNVASESSGRSRSGSSSSQLASHAQDLHKSSSDSVVAGEKRPPHAATHCIGPPQPVSTASRTQPINIPGSPLRAPHAAIDDMMVYVPEGKSRHPVRRSNSSPEMSSSWKPPASRSPPPAPPALPAPPDPPLERMAHDLILLPSEPSSNTSMSLHASKRHAAKKSDMRVSCEAIPEEMSGSSPLAHAPHPHQHLMTYNSDPGSGSAGSDTSASDLHHQLQKVASDSTVQGYPAGGVVVAGGGAGVSKPPAAPRPAPGPVAALSMKDRDDLPPLSRSKRSNTISVMSPTRRHRDQSSSSRSSSGLGGLGGASGAAAGAGAGGGGVTPSFLLLQLYHKMSTYPITPPVPGETPLAPNPLTERPLLVAGVQHERTIKNLDRVPPIETYKVGVLYVGPGQQDNEVSILKNEYGSVRYAEFLGQLGSLVSLSGCGAGLLDGAEPPLFLNLEHGGKDGNYTYVWHDDIMQVLFHVATAMPNTPSDPTCNEKRKYIGNDYVSIVYNDSGQDFSIQTIKGQFNLCIVVVEPFEHGLNRVAIKTKDERIRSKFLPHLETCTHVVSDTNVAPLARQLALHAALASHISQSLNLGPGQPYASNSLERLRLIKRLRGRVKEETLTAAANAPKPYAPDLAKRVAIDDFNDYI